MGLDIRIPLGLIFLLIGGIMSIYGLITRNAAIYEKSMGINLNLTWGAIMFVFGLIMFLVGRRQKWQDDPVNPRPWEKDPTIRPRHLAQRSRTKFVILTLSLSKGRTPAFCFCRCLFSLALPIRRCHPERSCSRTLRTTESKDLLAFAVACSSHPS